MKLSDLDLDVGHVGFEIMRGDLKLRANKGVE